MEGQWDFPMPFLAHPPPIPTLVSHVRYLSLDSYVLRLVIICVMFIFFSSFPLTSFLVFFLLKVDLFPFFPLVCLCSCVFVSLCLICFLCGVQCDVVSSSTHQSAADNTVFSVTQFDDQQTFRTTIYQTRYQTWTDRVSL